MYCNVKLSKGQVSYTKQAIEPDLTGEVLTQYVHGIYYNHVQRHIYNVYTCSMHIHVHVPR